MNKYTYITVTQTFKERFLVDIGEDFNLDKVQNMRNYEENREVIIFDTSLEYSMDKDFHLITQLHWFAGMDSFPVTMNLTTLSDFLFSAQESGNRVSALNKMEHSINVRDTTYPEDVYFYAYSLTIDEFISKVGELNFSYYSSKIDQIKKDNSVFMTFGFTNSLETLKTHEQYSNMQIVNSFSPFDIFLKETGILPFHFAPVPIIKYSILTSEILKYKETFEAV